MAGIGCSSGVQTVGIRCSNQGILLQATVVSGYPVNLVRDSTGSMQLVCLPRRAAEKLSIKLRDPAVNEVR